MNRSVTSAFSKLAQRCYYWNYADQGRLLSSLCEAKITIKEKRVYSINTALILLLFIATSILITLYPSLIPLLLLTGGLSLLLYARKKRNRLSRKKEATLFYLPLILERLIMALRSGNDLIGALHVVVELEIATARERKTIVDPITDAFAQVLHLINRGSPCTEAFDVTVKATALPQLRHALLYLKTSWIDGGDLIPPLIELSEATQSTYQDYVEEKLASLPVKAMAPLLLTFAGLLLLLLSTPLVALLKLTSSLPIQ
jgi:Flp pilus assembly protein TadB